MAGVLFSILQPGKLAGQTYLNKAEFDRIYQSGIENIGVNPVAARHSLTMLESKPATLSPLQKAKTSLLRIRLIYSDADSVKKLEARLFTPPDSLGHVDLLIYSARRFLEKSMPDKAIPLLLEAIDISEDNSDDEIYCKINLCEAYREKQEYSKGIGILTEILAGGNGVSEANIAFACNRLAAIFNESGIPGNSYTDSVFKYSERCITLSEKNGNKVNLAFSQNELSFQYNRKKQFEKALDMSVKAVRNFKEAGMNFSAMNALINMSNIHIGMKDYNAALQDLNEAASLCPIEENRNLFLRIYLQFSGLYELTGKYEDAFGFLSVAQQLFSDFYKDRINVQINEQSARFDLLMKEQKIKEEIQKTAFINEQKVFLLVTVIVLCIALIVSFFYFRLKRKNFSKQKLIEAIIETEAAERKRIARDLHDGLGPVLSAVNHYFQAYIDAGEADKEIIGSKLQQVISGAVDEVSRISHNISPHVLENSGLISALNNFIAPFISGSKVKVEFSSDFSGRFELTKELTIYRCITELLNNSMKHSGADTIILRISAGEKLLHVFYSDNGKGFETSTGKSNGMGLYNIKNRVETLGGKLSIESAPGKGIKVNIEIPL